MAPISRDGNSEASTSTSPSLSPPNSLLSHGPLPFDIRIPREFHSMTAGAGAGLMASITTCPLDVVKTRLQAQHLARDAKGYEGVQRTITRIWQQSGARGFYRGLGPTLGGYLPTWGIYFTVYDEVKDRLGVILETQEHPQAGQAATHVVAAMTAGATGTILTNPLWVVKTRFMVTVLPPSAARYRTTFDAIRTIYRNEGFGAFYKGLLPSLMGVSHVAVQFPLYEKAKQWAGAGSHAGLSPSTILICSASSKMIASLVTYPHEVLRTRLQIRTSSPSKSPSRIPPITTVRAPLYSPLVTGSDPPLPIAPPEQHPQIAAPGRTSQKPPWKPNPGGVIDTFLKIKHQDGWRGFYRGLSINLVRTVPNSAVTMLTYELIMRRLSLT
ncbi:mitochondrial carrier domain-containing protein [Naematelia encephala]|uniref:Mitochondrial carrier domain-containing protein n=1 Tax=Naematelia encephala TaxID=71784 RepID=A0A1Y2B8S2_9TREE|nr:mitochondrial carrier domain-containing protein [Naematelia encephala]